MTFDIETKTHQRGIAMMEILVTLVILAIGALGLASMQLNAMKYNKESAVRSKATLLAMELSDRMRANITGVKAASYDRNEGYTAALAAKVTAPSCGSGIECSSSNLAQLDLSDWLTDIGKDMPNGTGAVIPITNNSAGYNIVIMWTEKSLVDAGTTDAKCPTPLVAGVRCLSTPFIP
jgi:type IV pilus assembly protein PilV